MTTPLNWYSDQHTLDAARYHQVSMMDIRTPYEQALERLKANPQDVSGEDVVKVLEGESPAVLEMRRAIEELRPHFTAQMMEQAFLYGTGPLAPPAVEFQTAKQWATLLGESPSVKPV